MDFLGNQLNQAAKLRGIDFGQAASPIADALKMRNKMQFKQDMVADERAYKEGLANEKLQREQAQQAQQDMVKREAAFARSIYDIEPQNMAAYITEGVQQGQFSDQFSQAAMGLIGKSPEEQLAGAGMYLRQTGNGAMIPNASGKVGTIRYVDTGSKIQARDTRTNELLEVIDKTTPEGKKKELELKNQDIEIRTQERKEKLEQNKQERLESAQSSLDTVNRAIDTVDQIIKAPGLESAVGASSALPTLPGTEKANFEAILEKFQGQQFLEGVQQMRGLGTLTESEGRRINQAAGALNLNMSEGAFMKEVDIIRETLARAKARAEKKFKGAGGKISPPELTDDEILKKYSTAQ